jgi:hypothetical protein
VQSNHHKILTFIISDVLREQATSVDAIDCDEGATNLSGLGGDMSGEEKCKRDTGRRRWVEWMFVVLIRRIIEELGSSNSSYVCIMDKPIAEFELLSFRNRKRLNLFSTFVIEGLCKLYHFPSKINCDIEEKRCKLFGDFSSFDSLE